MKNLFILALTGILSACTVNEKVKVYGDVPTSSVVIAQVCLKEKNSEPEQKNLRYSILVKNNNFIRSEQLQKYLDFYILTAPLVEKRQIIAFILPFQVPLPQNFGFMWDMKEISVNSKSWTTWQEPKYTIQDISGVSFKKDNGLIGKQENSQVSPFLVRFKQMYVDDYIQQRVTKWEKDIIPECKQ